MGSVSEPSTASGPVSPLHLLLALIGLIVLAVFTYLRRPVLLLVAVAAVVLGGVGPEAPALGALGVVGALLLLGAEWLLSRSAGARILWPSTTALVACLAGTVCVTLHTWGEVNYGHLLGVAILIALPWTAVASAIQLGLIGKPDNPDAMATILVTRALLSGCREALLAQAGDVLVEGVGQGSGESWSDAMGRLDLLNARVPSMSPAEQDALRSMLLSARGLVEGGVIDAAVDCILKLPIRCDQELPSSEGDGCATATAPQPWSVRNAVALIHGYRKIVPPARRRGCRFEPSCSAYVEQALLRFGVSRGLGLGVRRALRCVPYGDEGFDPVPGHHRQPAGAPTITEFPGRESELSEQNDQSLTTDSQT